MANYIELIGSPGVGKTTTYNALARKYAADADWVLYEELCGIQPKKTVKEQIKQHLKRIIKPQSEHSLPYVERDRNILDRFIKSHPDFIELFWQTLPKSSNVYGKDLRGVVVGYVMEVLEKIQRVKEAHSEKYCLLDEGIVHNINYFVPSNLTDPVYESQVRDVFNYICLPKGVIYFEGDIPTIVDRTLYRGNPIPRDESLSREELIESRETTQKEKQVYIKVVKSRNIPLLRLESSDSITDKSKKIISFVKDISAS